MLRIERAYEMDSSLSARIDLYQEIVLTTTTSRHRSKTMTMHPEDGIQLPDDADYDPEGCDVCGTKTGNHAALCPDILDGLAMSTRPQGDDMFDFLIDLGHKLRDASYNLEN